MMAIAGQVYVYTAVSDAYKTVRSMFPREKAMKIARFIIASLLVVPSAFAFAQSTPPSIDGDLGASIAQQNGTYRYADRTEQTQAEINDAKRTALLPHQLAEMNVGRYSLSVVRPSF
jgi:hypothetical protein